MLGEEVGECIAGIRRSISLSLQASSCSSSGNTMLKVDAGLCVAHIVPC